MSRSRQEVGMVVDSHNLACHHRSCACKDPFVPTEEELDDTSWAVAGGAEAYDVVEEEVEGEAVVANLMAVAVALPLGLLLSSRKGPL